MIKFNIKLPFACGAFATIVGDNIALHIPFWLKPNTRIFCPSHKWDGNENALIIIFYFIAVGFSVAQQPL
jgi:hypothetical protein